MARGLTRRDALSVLGVGVAGSLAGCREAAVPGRDEPPPGDWPMFGYDAGNTGSSPVSPGPSGPTERWRFGFERGTNATPAVVDGTVYVPTLEGTLHALDAATGGTQWRTRASFPLFGTPAIVDGTVYVADGGGYLHVLADAGGSDAREGSDAATPRARGAFLWQVRGDAGFTSSPTVADRTVYLGTYEGDLHAFDAGDGTRRWTHILGDSVDVAPAVADGTLYATVPRGVVYAFDAATGALIWRTDLDVGLTSDPAVYGGTVYVGSTETDRYGRETRLFALDAATGDVEWEVPLAGGISGSPATVDGTVLAGTWSGTLHAFDAGDGTEHWRATVDHGVVGAPAIAGGTVYASGFGRAVHAVSVADGTTQWTLPTGDGIPRPPAVAGDAAYVATDTGELLAIGP